MRPGRQILLVGEDKAVLGVWRYVLVNNRPHPAAALYRVTVAYTAGEALEALRDGAFDAMICDAGLWDLEGLLAEVKELYREMAVVVLHRGVNANIKQLLKLLPLLTARKRGPKTPNAVQKQRTA